MSALTVAEERATSALSRLETLLARKLGDAAAASEGSASRSQREEMLERDCEQLRAERDALRRQLAAAEERKSQLEAIVGQVEDRLDGAITQLDELTGEQGVQR